MSDFKLLELRAIYFELFEQSEHSELMKSKFNPYYASRKPVPTTLKEAVLNGFLWGADNEDAIFWHKYYDSL